MNTSFQGRAKRLDDIDLPKLGATIGVGEDELHAFIDVETRGSGFDEQGRPRILFERHKFYKYVPAEKRAAAIKAGLANSAAGGYGKESEQYGKLLKAIAIDRKAALYSCSWGLAQIMGFNHTLAGYADVESMIEAFMDDEENHLAAAVTFIEKTGLAPALRAHNWTTFAKGYNGANYKINNYDRKLAEAFAKWSRIKNTPFPGAVGSVSTVGAQSVDQPSNTATRPVVPPETTIKPPLPAVVSSPPEAPPVLPKSKSGWTVLVAILSAIGAALARFHFGG